MSAAILINGRRLRAVRFTFDGDATFSGYTDDTTWNGWLNVWTTEDEHKKVRASFGDDPETLNAFDGITADGEVVADDGTRLVCYGYGMTTYEVETQAAGETRKAAKASVGAEVSRATLAAPRLSSDIEKGLDELCDVMMRLSRLWERANEHDLTALCQSYPFAQSFDEVMHEVITWKHAARDYKPEAM